MNTNHNIIIFLFLSLPLPLSYSSILKDKEPNISSVMYHVTSKDWRSKVLDPDASEFVVMNIIILKPTLEYMKIDIIMVTLLEM